MTKTETKSNRLPLTNEDTLGPYYPIPFGDQDSLDMATFHPGLSHKPKGEKIVVKGRVLDINGKLAHGSLLEFWQPNADGVYRTPDNEENPLVDPFFYGYARERTKDGSFILTTIKPGQDKENNRAPNITLTIFSDGIMRIVTQFFFDDEENNESDALLTTLSAEQKSRLLAKYAGKDSGGNKIYTIDIIMAGENETPFFDDFVDGGGK